MMLRNGKTITNDIVLLEHRVEKLSTTMCVLDRIVPVDQCDPTGKKHCEILVRQAIKELLGLVKAIDALVNPSFIKNSKLYYRCVSKMWANRIEKLIVSLGIFERNWFEAKEILSGIDTNHEEWFLTEHRSMNTINGVFSLVTEKTRLIDGKPIVFSTDIVAV